MLHRSIVIADDHVLFSTALSELISKSGRYEVLYTVENGKQLKERFRSAVNVPDIVLLDINMPQMDGVETAKWLSKDFAEVLVLALSMNNDEASIVGMLRNGAKGYLLKDTNANELYTALDLLCEKGFYYSELVTQHLVKAVAGNSGAAINNISEREMQFIQLACSEFTYKEIADQMNLSMRTIDGYRESLFQKLNVKSRVGLVMYAIANKLVKI